MDRGEIRPECPERREGLADEQRHGERQRREQGEERGHQQAQEGGAALGEVAAVLRHRDGEGDRGALVGNRDAAGDGDEPSAVRPGEVADGRLFGAVRNRAEPPVPERARAQGRAARVRDLLLDLPLDLPVEAAIGRREARIRRLAGQGRGAVRGQGDLPGDEFGGPVEAVGGAGVEHPVEDQRQPHARQRQRQGDQPRGGEAEPQAQRAPCQDRHHALGLIVAPHRRTDRPARGSRGRDGSR
ncbi:hypothetical protein CHKEEEPN_4995 [Methylorubrum podarium]|nr:hypothetical protein CHKEEEPN_4995 [Methylorubrum podarium]